MTAFARRRLRRCVNQLSLLGAPASPRLGQKRRASTMPRRRPKTVVRGTVQCVICWDDGAAADCHACGACGNAVCGACADRYLADRGLPPCPVCRSATWGLARLEVRALAGDADAALGAGLAHMETALAGDDHRKAVKFLKIAADADDAVAAHNLGTLFMALGRLNKSKRYLALAGLPVSLLNLAFVHRALGEGHHAVRALKKAALSLCPPAFYWLGLEYLHGSNALAKDPDLAIKLLQVAAVLGDVHALRFLAHFTNDLCYAAAFLVFLRDVVDPGHRDADDDHLLALHSLLCPAAADPSLHCPARASTCLCTLVPGAFRYVQCRRHHHQQPALRRPPAEPPVA